MPVAKGQEWGQPGLLPPGAPIASSDAEAAALVVDPVATIGLEDGDLARTLGIHRPYERDTPKHVVPVDALRVVLDDDSEHTCVAHVVVGDLRRQRHSVAIMNAAFIGTRNIAPRAHPGDGKVDVEQLNLELADRLRAWQRMVTGTHVPHPGIVIRQRAEGAVELERPQRVHVDGRFVGRARNVRFYVIPAAILIAVS